MVYRLIKFEPEPEERAFFAGFPGFPQDPGAPVSTEFARLAAFRHWASGSKTWKKNWNICMAAEYDRLIGSRIASPRSWRELCAKVGLGGSLPSIRQCRMALNRVNVNIIDLLDAYTTGGSPKKFNNLRELSKYTNSNLKFFNRNIAKQDKVLRVLLKKIQ